MDEQILSDFAHESHEQAVASVRTHLHTILVISDELSNGIDLAESCIRGARLARAKFDLLVQGAHLSDLSIRTGQEDHQRPTLNEVAKRAADLIDGGRKAQTLFNEFAATAAEAIATLKLCLQARPAARNAAEAAEMVEIHKHAADIVRICTEWVRLGRTMSHLLQHECAQLGHRLTEQARCEMLATQVLRRAQLSAGLGR